MKFFIVDVETTGTDPVNDRVIEVGVIVMENFRITDTFSSLVNPKVKVPDSIRALTGITDHMLQDAPSFEEILGKLEVLAEKSVFVAQNVMFDHGFLTHEYLRAGKKLQTEHLLCSRDVSRTLWSEARSHSLASIASRLEHLNSQPHRALPDAQVLSNLFDHINTKYGEEQAYRLLNKCIRSVIKIRKDLKNQIVDLPELTGVYYILDKFSRPLYIGKAKNIRQRIREHFSEGFNQSLFSKQNETVHEIKYNITHDENLASLLEDHEIRRHWPKFNTSQKRPIYKYSIYNYYDQKQRGRIQIIRSIKPRSGLYYFRRADAERHIRLKISEFLLSGELCGIGETASKSPNDHGSGYSDYLAESKYSSKKLTVYPCELRHDNEAGILITNQGHTTGVGFIDKKVLKSMNVRSQEITFNRYFTITPGPLVDVFTEKLINSDVIGDPLELYVDQIRLPKKFANLSTVKKLYNRTLFLGDLSSDALIS